MGQIGGIVHVQQIVAIKQTCSALGHKRILFSNATNTGSAIASLTASRKPFANGKQGAGCVDNADHYSKIIISILKAYNIEFGDTFLRR